MISPEQSGDIKKNYCGHKIELFLDNLGNQELDNLRDHKQHLLSEAKNTAKQLGYTKISLYVLSNNEIAQSLYKNSNFETTKLRMECSLNE